jgi:threonine dehydratase
VVLSGGNVDPRLLASVIMRGLIRDGRLSRLHIEVPDVPGSMGSITTILGDLGANIVEILHQRMFVDLSAKSAEIEVTVETLDHEHVERVVAALEKAGYLVQVGTFTYRDSPPDTTPHP